MDRRKQPRYWRSVPGAREGSSLRRLNPRTPAQVEGTAAVVEYVDFAEYYDFDHAITLDVEFYLDFARQCGSPILELACGTGRLVVPLAEAGFEVYGIDLSENMLAVRHRRNIGA